MFHFENELEKTISDEIQKYAFKEYSSHLISAMLSKDTCSRTSVAVDAMALFESSIVFSYYIFQNPQRALRLLDDAFQKVALEINKTHVLKTDMVYKENLHVRLISLPNIPEVYQSSLPNCSDVGKFLCISGTVVKASTAKILQFKKLWRCSKCKYQFILEAEVEQGYVCQKPALCKNPDFCNGKNFTLMSTDTNVEYCKDYQEIKLQEQVYNLSIGTVPRSMWVILEDDLVETCHPGNDVILSGILIQQWKPLFKGNPIEIDLLILAHNIEVQNKMTSGVVSKDMVQKFKQFWQGYKSDPLSGRNFILSSICPQVFGLYVVKLAVALVLAGGVQKKSGSSRIRGDSHMLLVGDPGTAKSQFLKFVTKVSPRSILTSGIGTTNAGLTVSAVKESGRWELEAGALVLADGGICCIDEFSCIKEHDKTCIHEAMEQQTISVAKAGLVCSLNTRCSILAATNPKSRYDESMSLSENTALGTPLLSRFDIILVLLDTYDENWDDMVATYILGGHNLSSDQSFSLWPASKIKSYFILVRHINPRMTAEAERILRSYYTKQRSFQSRNASRTTPRLLQSLIRLAEGHARLMLRTEVLTMDAVISIILVDSSMLDGSILEGLSPLHTIFPDNPMDEYVEKAEKVFQNLNVEINFEENYKKYYEETHLNNLLQNISGVWTSKENQYLFGGSSCDDSTNSNIYPNYDNSANEITTNKPDSEDSEYLYHNPAQVANFSQDQAQEVVLAESHENIIGPTIQAQELNNQVSTLSDLRNIFGNDITESETNVSKNIKNLSNLNQILNVQNKVECRDGELLETNTDKNHIKKPFDNPESDKRLSNENEMFKNDTTSFNFEESDFDILEELGITREKKSQDLQLSTTSRELSIFQEKESEKMETDPPLSSKECFKSSDDASITLNKLFSSKRSLADQLKSFAFTKSRFNSHPNFDSDKNFNKAGPSSISNASNEIEKLKSVVHDKNGEKANQSVNKIAKLHEDYNKAGPSSVSNAIDKIKKLKNKSDIEKSDRVNQFANKKSAFKMIVDRCKSSQNNVTEKKAENYLSFSEISQNSQNINILNCIQNDKNLDKITADQIESENVNEKQVIVQDHSSNKQQTNNLKKYLFSKKKTSETKTFTRCDK